MAGLFASKFLDLGLFNASRGSRFGIFYIKAKRTEITQVEKNLLNRIF